MKIKLASDIHLEFYKHYMDYAEFFDDSPDNKDTVLLLAGDIGVFSMPHTYRYFISDCAEKFRQVLWIPGNHEYYQGHYTQSFFRALEVMDEFQNVTLNNRFVSIVDDTAFICATLWSDLSDPLAATHAQKAMSDFRVIKCADRLFTPADAYEEHLKDVDFIFKAIQLYEDKKIVVMTHHAPSFASIHEYYRGNLLNAAYATELSERILDSRISLWAHGHTHDSFDYRVGDCRVLTNPKGYPDCENEAYVRDLVVEV